MALENTEVLGNLRQQLQEVTRSRVGNRQSKNKEVYTLHKY